MQCPEPGIYRDVPASEYHAWEAASKHALDKIIERTPLHLDYERKHPEPATKQMMMGTALHAMLPEKGKAFDQEVVVAPEGKSRLTNAFKELAAANPGKAVLAFDEMLAVEIMADNVRKHAIAGAILAEEGDNEVSVVWDDWITKVRCKARIDLVRPTLASLFDIKTTANAATEDFGQSIARYGYERQGWFYSEGYANAPGGKRFEKFGFICVENEPPYAAAVRELDAASLEAGKAQMRKALLIYAQCLETGNWYGYESIDIVGLPAWKLRQYITL